MPNCDPETGTPYGVVSMNGLEDWVWDEFLDHGRNLSDEAALAEWKAENPDADEEDEQEFWDYLEHDEAEYELETEGLKLGLSWLGGAPLVWVFRSPHVASVRPCSPCCPGAGDLDSPVEPGFGIVCYDLPPEWYRGDD